MENKLSAVLILAIFTIPSVSAVSPSYNIEGSQSTDEFSDTKLSETSGLSIPSLSFFRGPSVVEQGQTANLEWEVDMTYEQSPISTNQLDTSKYNTIFVVELYSCSDAGCDDPNQDKYLETYTFDAKQETLLGERNALLDPSMKLDASTQYTVPNDLNEGYHSLVAYLWTPAFESDGVDNDGDNVVDEQDGSERRVSNAPENIFFVGEKDPEEVDDETGNDSGPCGNIESPTGLRKLSCQINQGVQQFVGLIEGFASVLIVLSGFVLARSSGEFVDGTLAKTLNLSELQAELLIGLIGAILGLFIVFTFGTGLKIILGVVVLILMIGITYLNSLIPGDII